KFLRALTYFNLIRIYGDVPLVLHEVTNPEEGLQHIRQPVNDIYKQITDDLTAAEIGLPVAYSGDDVGRVTKGAAKALLGKVLITQHNYAEAALKLKEVIDLKVYALLDNYGEIFNPATVDNTEIIFEVKFKKGGIGEGSSFFNNFSPTGIGNIVTGAGTGQGLNIPTPDLLDAYEENDSRK